MNDLVMENASGSQHRYLFRASDELVFYVFERLGYLNWSRVWRLEVFVAARPGTSPSL